jgi:hypothetical protein
MNSFFHTILPVEFLELEAKLGSKIGMACEEALAIANVTNQKVIFDFNGVFMVVKPNDTVESLVNFFHKAVN